MKAAVASVLRRFGYRPVLVYNSLISAAFLAACASFVPGMPFAAMIVILIAGGFFRSLQFTAINTIAYAEIEPRLSAARPPSSRSASNWRSRPASPSARWWSNSRCRCDTPAQ